MTMLSRRQFLHALGWLGAGIAGLLSLWGTGRFLTPNIGELDHRARRLGLPGEFPIGTRMFLADALVYVVRDEEGFWAISARCSHVGCATNVVDWGFSCPCHGSKFDARGNVLTGPATTSLPWFRLTFGPDGALVLNASEQVPPGTRLKV